MAATPSPQARKYRLVYDAKEGSFSSLPGKLVREEGGKSSKDPAVNEAYLHAGYTYDFYLKVLGRNSLDDAGMSLISSVHLGRRLNTLSGRATDGLRRRGQVAVHPLHESIDVVGHNDPQRRLQQPRCAKRRQTSTISPTSSGRS
jgi:Zn-dependent metalloprotease